MVGFLLGFFLAVAIVITVTPAVVNSSPESEHYFHGNEVIENQQELDNFNLEITGPDFEVVKYTQIVPGTFPMKVRFKVTSLTSKELSFGEEYIYGAKRVHGNPFYIGGSCLFFFILFILMPIADKKGKL